jgi:type IX secretion system PorP/SprF family membrane protein
MSILKTNHKIVFRCCLLVTLLFVDELVMAQQQAQFTQYIFNQLILNPAFAGNEGALSVTAIDRSQWVSVDGAPRTQTFSAHTFFDSKNLGAGVSFVNDRIGVHKIQNLQGDISWRLAFSQKHFLSAGLRTGFMHRRSDYTSIAGTGAADPALANPDFAHTSLTLGAGLYYQSPKFQAGISAPSLLPEKFYVSDTVSIRWRRAQYFLFTRYVLPLNSSVELAPALLVKYLYGLPVSYDVNLSAIFKKVLTMGFSYRKKESVSFLLSASVTPQLKLGYGYDAGIGRLATGSGSHEAMLNYIFKYTRHNIVSPR